MQTPRGKAEHALLIAQLLNGIGYGLVFPIAAYTAEAFDTSASSITLVLSIHPLMRLLSGPLWGVLADRLGRKPVLLIGIALASAGHLVFGFAGSLWALAAGRALTGLGTGEMIAAAAIIADTTTGEQRAAGIGLLRASYGIGMLAGPLFGGLLALGGLQLPPRVAGVLCLCTFLFVLSTVRETKSLAPRETLAALSLREILSRPNLASALWIAGSATLALAIAEAIVALAIEHVLVPRTTLPWAITGGDLALLLTVALIMVWGLTMAFVEGWLAGAIAPRFGEAHLVQFGLVLWAFAYLVTPGAYLSGLGACALVLVATAAAAGLVSTCTSSLFSRSLPEHEQGSGFGLYQSAAAAGEFMGPAVAGLLFEQWFGAPYLAGTVLLVTALVAAVRLEAVPARG